MRFCYFYVLFGYMVMYAADTGTELSFSTLSQFKRAAAKQVYKFIPSGEAEQPFKAFVDVILKKNSLRELQGMITLSSLNDTVSSEVRMFWLHHIIAHPHLSDGKRTIYKKKLQEEYSLFQEQKKQENKQKLFTWLLAEEHMPIIEKHSQPFTHLFERSMDGDTHAMYTLACKTRRRNIPPLVPMYWLYKIQMLSHMSASENWFSFIDLDDWYTVIHTYAQQVIKDPEKQKLYPDFFVSLPKE